MLSNLLIETNAGLACQNNIGRRDTQSRAAIILKTGGES
jgi:hypothetical protein